MPVKLRTNGHLEYQLTEGDLNYLRRRDYHVCRGAAQVRDTLESHELCVMQLTNELLSKRRISNDTVEEIRSYYGEDDEELYDVDGYRWRGTNDGVDDVSDDVICVSEVIQDFLITLNDRSSDSDRQRLVDVIPTIVGTCPVHVHEEQSRRDPNQLIVVEERDETDEYLDAELRRIQVLGDVYDERTLDEKLAAVVEASKIR